MDKQQQHFDTTIHLDYLSFTLHPNRPDYQPSYILGVLAQILGEGWESASGMRAYTDSALFPSSGLRVLWGGETQRGTYHIIASGTTILHTDVERVIRYISSYGHIVVTRLDIALDKPGDDYLDDLVEIIKYVTSPYIKTIKEWMTYVLEDRPAPRSRTVYIGSRQSERMLRIYGKTDDEGRVYTRLEVELKGHIANEAFAHLMGGHSPLDVFAASVFPIFDAKAWLNLDVDKVALAVHYKQKTRLANSLAFFLRVAVRWAEVRSYYGKHNFDALMLQAAKDRIEARKARQLGRKLKTPVGDTGVTNWSAVDSPPISFHKFARLVENGFQELLF